MKDLTTLNHKQFSDLLVKNFPHFFQHMEDIRCSLMGFGVEAESGWFPLIYETLEKLDEVNDNPDFYITQIKEKFASIRIYCSPTNDKAWKVIECAEKKSMSICEICGKRGKLMERGYWLKTLCKNCSTLLDYKNCKPWKAYDETKK